jgi:arylsulfatase
MPTLCDLLKIPVPKDVDGVSVLPTILGKDDQQKQHEYLYFEYPEYGGQQAVRMGKWKAVRLNILKGTLKTQLFDLSNDIQEQHDIASQHPDIVKRMETIMKKEHHTPEVAKFRMKALENN